ncbi:hypothetical protein E2C01_092698 [Portunus trituberculatus]|uniref:Uncharacterized protein n=1 Tax=Portunus trituberculatus TaxID=210409 RepID=A0A5B7JS39_PORTR|nr:hypothetical protein [Portunus trituberculatus]
MVRQVYSAAPTPVIEVSTVPLPFLPTLTFTSTPPSLPHYSSPTTTITTNTTTLLSLPFFHDSIIDDPTIPLPVPPSHIP